MHDDLRRVKEVFLEAAALLDAVARGRFLDQACEDDAGLRARVEALLSHHDQAGSFLRMPAATVPDPAFEVTLAASLDQVVSQDQAVTQEGEDEDDSLLVDDDPLTFLTPAEHPNSLGWIGHYEVLQILGRGGFGIVFRVFDNILHRVVAVKVLHPRLATGSPARKRFLREARSSAKVRHENVVQVYEVGEQPLPYIAMEYIPGETLQQRIDRTGPLETPEVLRIGRQIAEALAAAHATDLIHRDVKPGNVLLEGASQTVKLTDFGLARAADDASLSQSGLIAGTPMYMAPEQATGSPIDRRADLFSLGSVLYQMVSGRPPFRANGTLAVMKRVAEDTPRPIRDIIPETPQWLCEIISRLHAKKPDDRFQSAREVADLLDHCHSNLQRSTGLAMSSLLELRRADGSLTEPETESTPPATPKAPQRPRFFNRYYWAAVALLATLLSGLGFAEATGVTDVRGTVIRLFSPEGALVVEVEDPEVSLKIDGSDVSITGAGVSEIRLKTGRHKVEGLKDGKVVAQELVTITRNGRRIVRISRESPPAASADLDREKTQAKAIGNEAGSLEPTADADRRAAETVLAMGGSVATDLQESLEILTVAELPREPFRLTVVIIRDNPMLTDDRLAAIEGCDQLKRLFIWGSIHVSDAGMRHLSRYKNLRELGLGGTTVTNSGLAFFSGLTTLETLHVAGTPVTAEGLSNFKNCKNLWNINLDSCPRFQDEDVSILLEWPKLGLLVLDGTGVTDECATKLAKLTKLNTLRLQRTLVTEEAVKKLAQALPQCRILWSGGVIEPK